MMRRPRAKSVHGRSSGPAPSDAVWTFGDLEIDVDGREVSVAETLISLTRTQFDILAVLARDPGVVFTRPQLISAVWGPSWVGDEHLVDVHIGHLRRKLGDQANMGRYVRTVRGIGYRMGTG